MFLQTEGRVYIIFGHVQQHIKDSVVIASETLNICESRAGGFVKAESFNTDISH